jgi:hypothetical protein
MTAHLRLCALLFLVISFVSRAQVVADREVEIVKALFDAGKYSEAKARSLSTLATLTLSDTQKIALYQFAGIAAFNLGEVDNAKSSYLELLRINPDFELDPFRFAPPALKLFETVRKSNASELDRVRQLIISARERAALERQTKEAAEAKQRIQTAGSEVLVRTVYRNSLVLNFLPFGVGQFQQGRTGLGVTLAVSEGVLAFVSVLAFWAIEGLFENVVFELPDRVTPDNQPFRLSLRRIPESKKTEVAVWRALKYGAGGGFFAVWAFGVVDALLHHVPESVVETKQAAPRASLRFGAPSSQMGATLRFDF